MRYFMASTYITPFRSLRNYVMSLAPRRGSALIALNEHLSYYNVRLNHIEIRAGTETVVKVEPVSHVASEGLASLRVEDRKCLYPDEREVGLVVNCQKVLSFL